MVTGVDNPAHVPGGDLDMGSSTSWPSPAGKGHVVERHTGAQLSPRLRPRGVASVTHLPEDPW
eukprot:4393212-Alexandrium_andersonii.AAC.1